MTQGLILAGSVALLFGLAAIRIQGEVATFAALNLGLALAAFLLAAGQRLRNMRRSAPNTPRGPLLRSLLQLLVVTIVAVGLERGAAVLGWRADWTFERQYELAPASRRELHRLDDLRIRLYYQQGDPRVRRTRLLLEQMAAVNSAELQVLRLEDHPRDEEAYGIGSSNSVVLDATGPSGGARWELVQRPTEGTLFEALARLAQRQTSTVYLSVGTGEGSIVDRSDLGYSGLGAALETEGYRVRTFPTAFATEIPSDADALLVMAPERRLRPEALGAIRRFLARGGRLVAMLEPGRESGLEEVLSEYGLTSPPGLLIDPASASIDGETPGTAPIAFNYAKHPVTQGLDRNRVTFFRGTRSFRLHKADPSDRLRGVVTASPSSWISDTLVFLDKNVSPEPPPGARTDYHPIAVTGLYSRGGTESRIVAFGDSDFASNRYLRSLYNLDLAINAMHWVTERESEITLRPKGGGMVQFPVPIQSSLSALYGAGLLVPELLLIGGGLAWLRRRGA